MPKKLMRLVRKLKKEGKVKNPWAVAVKATGQKPHRKKKRKAK